MLFGLVFLIIIIFLIHVGISGGDYGLSYFGILFLTMAFWGGYKSSTEDHTNGGCLPELLLVVSLMVWMLLGQTDCGENFPLFILAYFIIVISYILYSVNAQNDGKHKKLDIETKSEGKLRAEKILDTLKWTRTGSLQNDTPTYISLRHEAPSIADFDWVIKYISIYGRNSNSNPLNYYTNKYAFIGKSLYMCNKINSSNTVLHIYREPISEAEKKNLQEASYPSGMEPKFVVDKVGRSSSSYIPQTSSQKYRINNVRNVEAEVEESVSGSIEASIGVDESSDSPDNERAVRILNVQNWVELIARDKGRFQYVCRKDDSPDPDDFKWVVGYLSGRGIPENPKNPHTYVVSELDGVKYKSIKVNKFFEGTVIYKMVDTAIISFEENSGSIHSTAEKFRHHIYNYLTGNSMEEDPVVQYNLELIEEYKLELKEKIEAYNRLKAQKDDEIIISQSTTGMIDLEELNDQLDELREEIEDLIADIEDLKEENEEIREDFIDDVNDGADCPVYCSPIERKRVLYKECYIAGIAFHDLQDIWDELYVGVKLALVRQKDNKYDNNAIAITLAEDYDGDPDSFDFDSILGYVPRKENSYLASMMDNGMAEKIECELSHINGNCPYNGSLRVKIYIY